MSNLPPETKALRQTIYVGLIAFILGFAVVLAALGWLIASFVPPDGRWWDILHVSINAVLISVFGGLCFSAGSVLVLSRIHYQRGIFRCPYCDGPLKGAGILCGCPGAQALKK